MGQDSGSWFQRRAAVRLLAQQGKQGDPDTKAKLNAALCDESADVREAAVRALAQVSAQDDEAVRITIVQQLRDSCVDVQCAALESLAVLSSSSSSGSSSSSSSSIIIKLIAEQASANSEASSKVRIAALKALCKAAGNYWLTSLEHMENFDHVMLAADIVTECTRDVDDSVAHAALEALSAVGPGNPDAAIEAATKSVASTKVPIKSAALRAFASLCTKGDEGAMKLVRSNFRDADSAVRAAALAAAAQIALVGDTETTHALCRCGSDVSATVREAAMMALLHVACRGNLEAGLAALNGIRDDEPIVRRAAARLFAQVASKGNQKLITAAGKLLTSSERDVRLAAIAALEELCDDPDEDDRALREVCKHLLHKSKQVRGDMVMAIRRLGGEGSSVGIDECRHGLTCWDSTRLRQDSMLALRDLCGDCQQSRNAAVDMLTKSVDADPCLECRVTALKVLSSIGLGNRRAALAAASALTHKDKGIRATGLSTLVAVAPKADVWSIKLLVGILPLKELKVEERADIRVQLIRAIASIAEGSNDEVAVDALIERMLDPDKQVRLSSLHALEQVAQKGNAAAIHAVASLLSCECVETRNQAMIRLRCFAAPWDKQATLAATKRTACQCYENRIAALHALAGIVDPGAAVAGEEYLPPDEEVVQQLVHLSVEDDYQPVKRLAASILQHIQSKEPIELAGYGSLLVAPPLDNRRFMEAHEKTLGDSA